MHRLRAGYGDELVLLGIHSGKFPAEKDTANIRQAVRRHGIEHPVLNDADYSVWESFAVRAWPTVILVDPAGRVIAEQVGEVDADALRPAIDRVIEEFEGRGGLDRTPLAATGDARPQPDRPATELRFPAKVALAGDRLYVADTGRHRVLELVLEAGGADRPQRGLPERARLARVWGSGRPALVDGHLEEAALRAPHGLAVAGGSLYVADTDNHALRAIDLATGEVSTVAGTGRKARGRSAGGADPTSVSLRSPWAVAVIDDVLLVAMAGSHQIWALVDRGRRIGPFAGSGHEALVDGSRSEASFNQPSDLALGPTAGGEAVLWVADAEASAVRAVTFEPEPRVSTLVGRGLFAFGDVDGRGAEVRLQHPTGLARWGERLLIADSYNQKVKLLDPASGRVETLIGSGRPGHEDGPFERATLFEPQGLAVDGSLLAIADTNNHAIRLADLEARTVSTLEIRPAGGRGSRQDA